jgi:hypothetical protein
LNDDDFLLPTPPLSPTASDSPTEVGRRDLDLHFDQEHVLSVLEDGRVQMVPEVR